jgi:NTE family protein
MLTRLALKEWQKELRDKPRDPESPFAPDATIYFINASLGEIVDPDERLSLMKIPTSLYLTDDQIDRLVRAASDLLLRDTEFLRLMEDLRDQ